MAETGAVFGGEHSGHYYFRDNYRADSGLIAAVIVLEQLSRAGRAAVSRCSLRSGGTATRARSIRRVDDQIDQDRGAGMRSYADGRQDRTDGLTVEFDDWWFNVRPSNTEPLLRLNVEARTEELLKERDRPRSSS